MPKKTQELEITDKTTFVSAFISFPPHYTIPQWKIETQMK